jgi:urea transport system permease protein
MRQFFHVILILMSLLCSRSVAQTLTVQDVLQTHRVAIETSSRKTIEPAIFALRDSGLAEAQIVLEAWQSKAMWQRADGLFFRGQSEKKGTVKLFDFVTGADLGEFASADLDQIKPNSGIRAIIGAALVQFQLQDQDPALRHAALESIARDGEAAHLGPLQSSIASETDPQIKALKERTIRLLTIRFGETEQARIDAIVAFRGDLGSDLQAVLNPLLLVARKSFRGDAPPEGINLAKIVKLERLEAYDVLSAEGEYPPRISAKDMRDDLTAHIENQKVGDVSIEMLNTDAARFDAYSALAVTGIVPTAPSETEINQAVASHIFFDQYVEPSKGLTSAASTTLKSIETKIALNQALDLGLDALSLASIYFLAAIGLAITFGVMGVINMAHGEFIMMGAYTGYVVQQMVPNYTVSILIALPLAFAVTFAVGVAMERLVIRWLYNRPLETLLATFGISIALQQLAKNVFGTQARPLTSPAWLDGAWIMNDIVSISYIRIAIFVLALIFLAAFLFIMKRTRLGLEVRAVTQNPRMAASMGINPDKINMLTFGLGSGIAGIAGVAIGLFAKVTSELGSDYIVQSFMTVVVGGVGNIWGALLGASMIGTLQKGIEWLNPSNTLAAQTYMILFIIIFIQFRPRGIIALRGRAAGD